MVRTGRGRSVLRTVPAGCYRILQIQRSTADKGRSERSRYRKRSLSGIKLFEKERKKLRPLTGDLGFCLFKGFDVRSSQFQIGLITGTLRGSYLEFYDRPLFDPVF